MAVYFIQAGESGPVKVGTAIDPSKRLAELQTAHHQRLILIGIINGGREVERGIHARFESYRISGEWFEPVPELVALAQPFSPRPRKRGAHWKHPLGQYLDAEGVTLKDFGALVRVSHASLSRVISGRRTPSLELAQRIRVATNGAVTPNDLAEFA